LFDPPTHIRMQVKLLVLTCRWFLTGQWYTEAIRSSKEKEKTKKGFFNLHMPLHFYICMYTGWWWWWWWWWWVYNCCGGQATKECIKQFQISIKGIICSLESFFTSYMYKVKFLLTKFNYYIEGLGSIVIFVLLYSYQYPVFDGT